MTVITSQKDVENLRLTVVAMFEAEPERVWEVWEDARKLERWWGPPTYPATFTRHEFRVGGESRYHMTGPDGYQPRGWWRINDINKPTTIEFLNGLAGADGEPAPGVAPMVGTVTFEPLDGGVTRMTAVTNYVSVEQMQTMLEMGMEAGMKQAMGQIDGLLSAAVAA